MFGNLLGIYNQNWKENHWIQRTEKKKQQTKPKLLLKRNYYIKITVFYFNKKVEKTCKLWDKESKDIKGNKLHNFTVFFPKRIACY